MAKAGVVQNPFRTTLGTADFMAGDVACVAAQYIELGRYVVQAGVALALGYEAMSGQDSANGRLYLDLKNNAVAPGVAVNGKIRIDLHNAQDRVQSTIFEGRTERLRSSATDPRQQLPFPWINAIATEDVCFVLKFRADAAVTVGKANTTLSMDATIYEAQ
jgi:cellobiose phosphorylase